MTTVESALPLAPAAPTAALRTAPEVRAHRVSGRRAAPSPLMRAAGAVHAGARRPAVVLVDGLALFAVARVLSAGVVLPTVTLAGLVLSGRVYRDRDRILAHGLAWWPRLLAGPPVAAALVACAVSTIDGGTAAVSAAASWAALLSLRAVCWVVVVTARQAGRDLAPALVVGTGEQASTLARTLERHPSFGLTVAARAGTAVLADPTLLADVIRANGSTHVFLVADGSSESGSVTKPLRRALHVHAHVSLIPAMSDALLSARPGRRVGGVAVLPLGRPLRGPSSMPGKRAFDLVVSALLLLVASPALAAAAIAIRLDDGDPCLFRQTRTGRNGRPFGIVKLRTMRVGAHADQSQLTAYNTSDGLLFKMSDDPRVTRIGHFLRRSGLDELPQLLNVLRGEMSLVGPRPLPVESEAFSARDVERHLVRPGMTGLWQVSGGASLRYREMVDLDLAYIHCWSPAVDALVLLSTVGVLLRATVGRGAPR